MWVEFGDGSLPRVERLFFLSISIVYKHQHFQIPIRPGMVDEQPLLEFVIAKSLFIYLLICCLVDCIKMVPREGPYKPSRGVPLAVKAEA